jgi:hypothetical protein
VGRDPRLVARPSRCRPGVPERLREGGVVTEASAGWSSACTTSGSSCGRCGSSTSPRCWRCARGDLGSGREAAGEGVGQQLRPVRGELEQARLSSAWLRTSPSCSGVSRGTSAGSPGALTWRVGEAGRAWPGRSGRACCSAFGRRDVSAATPKPRVSSALFLPDSARPESARSRYCSLIGPKSGSSAGASPSWPGWVCVDGAGNQAAVCALGGQGS